METPHNKQIDELAANYGRDIHPDVERALSTVQQRIKEGDVRKSGIRRRWLQVAAVGILVVLTGYWGLRNNGAEVIVASAEETLVPVTLPDGTEVILQQGATLAYDQEYNQTARSVSLSGQAFFRVHKDKQRPFTVHNQDAQLLVTGTAFNLRVSAEIMEVEVSEGNVVLSRDAERVLVGKHQRGTSEPGAALQLVEAPALNRHAWRTGVLRFAGETVGEALDILNDNFGIKASASDTCSFPVSGLFTADNPEAILESIALLGGGELVASEVSPNTFILEGFCD